MCVWTHCVWLFDLRQISKLSLEEYQVLCWHVMIMYDDYILGMLKALHWYQLLCVPKFLAWPTHPLHIWQAAEESSGAFRTQGSPAWVSLGHSLQHHLVEGLGNERRGQLSKVILEDACGQRGPLWLRHPGF